MMVAVALKTIPIGSCSRDPIEYHGSEWGLYEYCSSKAVSSWDPFGLKGNGHHMICWSLFHGKVSKEVEKIFDGDDARLFDSCWTDHNYGPAGGVKHPDYGQVTPHYRTAKTWKRGISIKATKLEVLDDSDDLSDGEMAFTFLLLPSTIHPKEALMEDLYDFVRWPELSGNEGAGAGYLQVCSGAVLYPSVDLTAFDVGNQVRYAVSGYDDDVDGVYDVGPLPYPYEYTGAFDTHFGEANANFWTLDIDGGTFETSTEDSQDLIQKEQFDLKLVASAPANDTTCLEFKVHFTVSVFYHD